MKTEVKCRKMRPVNGDATRARAARDRTVQRREQRRLKGQRR